MKLYYWLEDSWNCKFLLKDERWLKTNRSNMKRILEKWHRIPKTEELLPKPIRKKDNGEVHGKMKVWVIVKKRQHG